MALEASAGENPVAHVGKLYNVAVELIAWALVSALLEMSAGECVLVSRIGAPIDEPRWVSFRLRNRDGRPAAAAG